MESARAFRFPDEELAIPVKYGNWELWDPTGQVGYAIRLESEIFDAFKDTEVFGDARNKTRKLPFSYALHHLLNCSLEGDYELINGTRTERKDGVVVVAVVAHLLAGFLVVAVCLAAVLDLSYNHEITCTMIPTLWQPRCRWWDKARSYFETLREPTIARISVGE